MSLSIWKILFFSVFTQTFFLNVSFKGILHEVISQQIFFSGPFSKFKSTIKAFKNSQTYSSHRQAHTTLQWRHRVHFTNEINPRLANLHWISMAELSLNLLRRSDAYMLVACSATTHYLNQWWLIVNWTQRNMFRWSFMHRNMSSAKMAAVLSRPQCVKVDHWHLHGDFSIQVRLTSSSQSKH